jgi:hypothetical protein
VARLRAAARSCTGTTGTDPAGIQRRRGGPGAGRLCGPAHLPGERSDAADISVPGPQWCLRTWVVRTTIRLMPTRTTRAGGCRCSARHRRWSRRRLSPAGHRDGAGLGLQVVARKAAEEDR